MGIITTAAEAKQMLLELYEWQHGPLDIVDEALVFSLLGTAAGGTTKLTIKKPIADAFANTITNAFPVLSADAEIYVDAVRFIPDSLIPADVANWATFRVMRYALGVPAGIPVMAQRSTSTAPDGGQADAFLPYDIPFFLGDTHLLLAGEVLVLDITKNFAGQFVGVGVWEIVYHYT